MTIDCIQQPNGHYGFIFNKPEVAKTSNVIYGLLYKDKWYVGKTQQEIRKRMCQHLSHARRNKATTEFDRILKKTPWKLKLTILERVQPSDDINEREIYWIDKLKAYQYGFNSNKGAGGSNTYPDKDPSPAEEESRTIPSTPVKQYPFSKDEDGRIIIKWTPGAYREKNVVYGIGDTKKLREEYVGESGNFVKRVQNHLTKIRKKPSKKATRQKLYEKIQKSPSRFSAYVFSRLESPAMLRREEGNVMRLRKLTIRLLNVLNSGGGGLPAPIRS